MGFKSAYYNFINKVAPQKSKRRNFFRFLYRFLKCINSENLKLLLAYIAKNGFRELDKKIYDYVMSLPSATPEYKSYTKWIKNNEPSCKELDMQKQYKFEYSPKISIVVPMYNTRAVFLNQLLESLKEQTYSNWELCLADGSQKRNEYIDEIIKYDSRIKYILLEKNEGIAKNTNEAILNSTGEYIAFLDHDDILAPFALHEILIEINKDRDVEFIYSDEDKFKKSNKDRYDPHFKPDFSPDTLRSYNYICHFSIIKRELLLNIGLLDERFDGSQDYDLIFRATERAKKIVHIPKILYHWRVHENSVALTSDAKMYAYEAAIRAIKEHLKRVDINVDEVAHAFTRGFYRIKYNIKNNPKISIIIPNKDSLQYLKECIDSILKSSYTNYEIIIVENNSVTDEIFEYYETIKNTTNISVIRYQGEFNYSNINNYAIDYSNGEYILFLNNDVKIINHDWLEELLSYCQRDDVGIVGAKLLYDDNSIQHAGIVVGISGVAGHINKLLDDSDAGYYGRALIVNNYSAVTAACMMIKKELFLKVNGFDSNLKVAYNDVDLCLKIIELGKLIVYNPYVKLYHYESKTRGYENTKEKLERFNKEKELFRSKWINYIEQGDPYFNINFRLDSNKFSINPNKIIR